jgi:hypothetical protein
MIFEPPPTRPPALRPRDPAEPIRALMQGVPPRPLNMDEIIGRN